MNTVVNCPACGQPMAVTPGMMGKQVKCPRCLALFFTKEVAPPTAIPAVPASSQSSLHRIARTLEKTEAFNVKNEPEKRNFKKDFVKAVSGEDLDSDESQSSAGNSFPWLLLALPLLLFVPLVLYLCGTFDAEKSRPSSRMLPVQQHIVMAPPIHHPPVVAQPPNQIVPPNQEPKKEPPPDGPIVEQPPPQRFEGLVGYWPMDLRKGDNPLEDASGRGNTLRIRQGGVAPIPGARGGAIQLKPNTALDYGESEDFNFPAGGSFTVACWLKTLAPSGTVISQRHSKDEGAVINLTVEAGRAVATVRRTGNLGLPAAVRSTTLVNDNAWHHCAIVRRGNVIELYVNGVSMGSVSHPGLDGPIVTDWRSVGMERKWASQNLPGFFGVSTYFSGAIDELCIFNRCVTPEELRHLTGR
jgi:hypothetical protein